MKRWRRQGERPSGSNRPTAREFCSCLAAQRAGAFFAVERTQFLLDESGLERACFDPGTILRQRLAKHGRRPHLALARNRYLLPRFSALRATRRAACFGCGGIQTRSTRRRRNAIPLDDARFRPRSPQNPVAIEQMDRARMESVAARTPSAKTAERNRVCRLRAALSSKAHGNKCPVARPGWDLEPDPTSVRRRIAYPNLRRRSPGCFSAIFLLNR